MIDSPTHVTSIADLRRDYALAALDIADVVPDPIDQFRLWFENATSASIVEPNAMTLATVCADGTPDARIVLLKGLDQRGFTFFTDYRSQKGQDLATHPQAALVFHWVELERQVRVRGTAVKLDSMESAAYYHSRPRGSQLGAWASEQSLVISDRATLDAQLREIEARFPDDMPPPLPPHWGGYVIIPRMVEFWQGRQSRLHDRVRYRRDDDSGEWLLERLSP
jgi:pyridoxamine 5'-phosphate oxidase